MNKEFLDKYSKISTIVIAIIVVTSFISLAYSKVWIPHQERLSQERQKQKYFEDSKKQQENRLRLDKCYSDVQSASHQRLVANCTTKPNDDTYFYCGDDFSKSNLETEQIERKNCEQKYPLNF